MKDANGYKIIRVTSIPDCDLCKAEKQGIYDGPVAGYGSSWGNMCQECVDLMSSGDTVDLLAIGGKRELIVKSDSPDPNGIVQGKTVSDIEAIICGDANFEVECPACGEIRQLEPDAHGTYKCEGCDRKVKIPSIM